LIVHESSRSGPLELLSRQGFQCATQEDPYAAMAELARRPLAYRAVFLSLQSVYQEELLIIPAIKRRWPHLDIWLTHVDGRVSTLADAMRLGADGLLAEDGQLHRTAVGAPADVMPLPSPILRAAPVEEGPSSTVSPPITPEMEKPAAASAAPADMFVDQNTGEPVLTADELRALLQDPPATLPAGNEG
jgi:hypothetical protein